MRFDKPEDFISAIRGAPYRHKQDWICSNVRGKDVLDLGIVAHSLNRCLENRETWLHHMIKNHGRFVLGIDILEPEVQELQKLGYNAIVADALSLRLDRKFDVVVCGDLIEHVTNPGALLETMAYHLRDNGTALVTTPNPFGVSRFFNILADGWTDINTEHVFWLCPQTMFQLVGRSSLFIDEFCWLETDFPMLTEARFYGRILNGLASRITTKKQVLRNDYGVLLRKRIAKPRTRDIDQAFVSVILPTYNRREYLLDALRSLLAQNYPRDRFEIIVVDNGSNDDTPQSLQRWVRDVSGAVNLKYVCEKRRGLVFARHTGAANAAGEILIFGDDDAIFDKNWISAIISVYRNYPEVGAVGTKISILWDTEPEPWVRKYEDVLGKLDYGPETLIRPGLYINGGSFSIRNEILLRVGGFNPGQTGDYIIGDSEPGLCRKLARDGVAVAWTGTATMWHRQQAKVNGTFRDMKRRFRNNGIADAYHASFYDWTRKQVIVDLCRKSLPIFRRFLSAVIRRDWAQFQQDIPLEVVYYLEYIRYLCLYRVSVSLRDQVSKGDWRFTSNYEAPPAQLLSQCEKWSTRNNGSDASGSRAEYF